MARPALSTKRFGAFRGIQAAAIRAGYAKRYAETGHTWRVYFVQSVNGGPIKIGFTTDIGQRLRLLQTSSPEELRVIAIMPGTHALETTLHRRLKDHRIRGEWYRDCEAVRAVMREVCP